MSAATGHNPFSAQSVMDTPSGKKTIYRLDALNKMASVDHLPYSIKVLLEACLRNCDGHLVTAKDVEAVLRYDAKSTGSAEIPFMPGRVVLQDFTGVPAVVDLAAMRAAMKRLGGDPKKVNPLVPCDLVIDHSVQVDAFGNGMALQLNSEHEFQRNQERYQFLKWGQQAFNNFRVVPPATGIVHQVNLEYLAKAVWAGFWAVTGPVVFGLLPGGSLWFGRSIWRSAGRPPRVSYPAIGTRWSGPSLASVRFLCWPACLGNALWDVDYFLTLPLCGLSYDLHHNVA